MWDRGRPLERLESEGGEGEAEKMAPGVAQKDPCGRRVVDEKTGPGAHETPREDQVDRRVMEEADRHEPGRGDRDRGAHDSIHRVEEVGLALERVRAAGYTIANVDSTLILAAPRIGPHATAIRERVAKFLEIPVDSVGLKAKTPEGMGTENAAIAHVIVLLEKRGRGLTESKRRVRKA